MTWQEQCVLTELYAQIQSERRSGNGAKVRKLEREYRRLNRAANRR